MVQVLRVRTHPGKRHELIELLPGSHANRAIWGRDVVIWSSDPNDEDQLFVFEYWSHLQEFAAGSHSEYESKFHDEAGHLIAETSVMLEASPAWTMGVPAPAKGREPGS